MIRVLATAAVVAVAGGIGTIWYLTQRSGGDNQFAQCGATQIVDGVGTIGGPFELVNAAGQTVTDADVITKPSLLYFGYTFCPDVCPLDMARNADAVDILEQNGDIVTPVFISIDPARDTPEVVGDFAENLHDRLIGLTGSPEQIKNASVAYKTYYKAHPAEDDYYLVDHTTFSYLVLPEHGFVEFFRRDMGPEEMADKIACFVAAA